jgi:hypothetical protein
MVTLEKSEAVHLGSLKPRKCKRNLNELERSLTVGRQQARGAVGQAEFKGKEWKEKPYCITFLTQTTGNLKKDGEMSFDS